MVYFFIGVISLSYQHCLCCIGNQQIFYSLKSNSCIRIHLSNVPSYLHSSLLYGQFVEQGQTTFMEDSPSATSIENSWIEVPEKNFKASNSVSSLEDLQHMLKTLDFWCSDSLPDELIVYCVMHPETVIELLETYCNKLSQICPLIDIVGSPKSSLREKAIASALKGEVSILRCLWRCIRTSEASAAGVLSDRTAVPKQPSHSAYEKGLSMDWDTQICVAAASSGSVSCLRYAREQMGCGWGVEVCTAALRYRQEACLRYAMQHNCPIPKERSDCLPMASTGTPSSSSSSSSSSTTSTSTPVQANVNCKSSIFHSQQERKSTSVLRFMPTPKAWFCTGLAAAGYLDLLISAHEQGCPWDDSTTTSAARGGHLDCLQYAHEQGCAWSERVCSSAAHGGHLAVLVYAVSRGCAWDKYTCSNAAEHGHLHCLRYAHEQGCPWEEYTVCKAAARNGHLSCLHYAHEQGCRWDKGTCSNAAAGGQLECLQYAHERGCPWDEDVSRQAALHGNLPCLRYVHEHGCPWDEDTTACAAEWSNVTCLEYAILNGCPYNQRTAKKAAKLNII